MAAGPPRQRDRDNRNYIVGNASGAPNRNVLEPILDTLREWNSVLKYTSLGNPDACKNPSPANDEPSERTIRRRAARASRYMTKDGE